MGLPFGGEDINELPLCDKGNEILEEWRGQYSGDKFNGEEYLRRIQSTTKANLMFRLKFLTLFVNNFIESMLMGTNRIKVVRKLVLVEDFSKLNWCISNFKLLQHLTPHILEFMWFQLRIPNYRVKTLSKFLIGCCIFN
ncbi:unnamed protein product [Lactuca saligna]|uniref:Uncharacterized protein n=1 Tax=Lactuca saligna TaxID=75948 RepID=A0AA35YBZ6_LACSI|nr:unnamed protein product [Lactuca saligna]